MLGLFEAVADLGVWRLSARFKSRSRECAAFEAAVAPLRLVNRPSRATGWFEAESQNMRGSAPNETVFCCDVCLTCPRIPRCKTGVVKGAVARARHRAHVLAGCTRKNVRVERQTLEVVSQHEEVTKITRCCDLADYSS